jgi:hypothetical protein
VAITPTHFQLFRESLRRGEDIGERANDEPVPHSLLAFRLRETHPFQLLTHSATQKLFDQDLDHGFLEFHQIFSWSNTNQGHKEMQESSQTNQTRKDKPGSPAEIAEP